jgi:hypothetical protein
MPKHVRKSVFFWCLIDAERGTTVSPLDGSVPECSAVGPQGRTYDERGAHWPSSR